MSPTERPALTQGERAGILAHAWEHGGGVSARTILREFDMDADDVGRAAKRVSNPCGLLREFSARTITLVNDYRCRQVYLKHAFAAAHD